MTRSFSDSGSESLLGNTNQHPGLNYLSWVLPVYRPREDYSNCLARCCCRVIDVTIFRFTVPVLLYASMLLSYKLMFKEQNRLGESLVENVLQATFSPAECYFYGLIYAPLQPTLYDRRHMAAKMVADGRLSLVKARFYLASSVLLPAYFPAFMSLIVLMASPCLNRSRSFQHSPYNVTYGILASLELLLILLVPSLAMTVASRRDVPFPWERSTHVPSWAYAVPAWLKGTLNGYGDKLINDYSAYINHNVTFIEPPVLTAVNAILAVIASIGLSYSANVRLKYAIKGKVANRLISCLTAHPSVTYLVGLLCGVVLEGGGNLMVLFSVLAFSRLLMIDKDQSDGVTTLYHLMLSALFVHSSAQLLRDSVYLADRYPLPDPVVNHSAVDPGSFVYLSDHPLPHHGDLSSVNTLPRLSQADAYALGFAWDQQLVTLSVLLASIVSLTRECCDNSRCVKALLSFPLYILSHVGKSYTRHIFLVCLFTHSVVKLLRITAVQFRKFTCRYSRRAQSHQLLGRGR